MDYNKIAVLEHQVEQKYGIECTRSPRDGWTLEDEKEYVKQVDQLYQKFNSTSEDERYQNKSGYLVSKKLLTDETAVDHCSVCKKYRIHFTALDDIKMNQWECCYRCFTLHIEDREEKWRSGWRPDSEQIQKNS